MGNYQLSYFSYAYIPFGDTSSYRKEFLNWGYQRNVGFEVDREPTILKNMPFNGRSSYSTSFKGAPSITDHESDRLLNNARHGRLFKNPLGPIVPFMDKTTTGTNFRANKINGPNIVRSKYVISSI